MRKRLNPESAMQRALFSHLKVRASAGVFAFHVPNGGYRKPIEAAILKGLGVRAGVPDVIALHDGKFFALELKAPGGRPTANQLEAITAINDAGGYAAWTDDLDRALAMLEMWGVLRPNAVRCPKPVAAVNS
jgi:hypothetical protein